MGSSQAAFGISIALVLGGAPDGRSTAWAERRAFSRPRSQGFGPIGSQRPSSGDGKRSSTS